MQHHRDLAVTRTHDHFDVPANERAKAFFRIAHTLYPINHSLLRDVHRVIHQVEQNFIFALEMMIEPSFAKLQGCRHVVHGGGIVASLLKEASRGTENFLARINSGLAGHGEKDYTERKRIVQTSGESGPKRISVLHGHTSVVVTLAIAKHFFAIFAHLFAPFAVKSFCSHYPGKKLEPQRTQRARRNANVPQEETEANARVPKMNPSLS